ncbi:YitT family protein [Lacticaseibacillus yichunensis]
MSARPFFKSLFSSVTYLLSFNLFYDLAFQVTLSIWFDVPLACVAVAFGYYCCISENASTVGVDVIALILHRRNEQIRIAPTIRNINFVILGVGLFVFGWKSVAFGIGFSILYAWILRHMLRE